jgi:indolepyruvate ferredoxin oxidoreductase beta subunit
MVEDESVTNILMCGVGGQGVILASNVVSIAAMLAGYEVKKSEVHGMSQRGGSVVTHVRFGESVSSPLISMGRADVMMAFEKLEALRYIPFMGEHGLAIVNTREMVPTTVSSGPFEYPEGIIEALERHMPVIVVDGPGIARNEVGNARTANTVLLGALATKLDITGDIWRAAIYRSVPSGTEKLNMMAFEAGRRVAKEAAELPKD